MDEPIKKYKVLLIDDDKKLCDLIAEYLSGYDIECECAHDGESGLARFGDEQFDALLLDMRLPGMDGLEVLRRLRAQDQETPVVIISAQTDVSDRVVGLEMGADDYVPKVFSPRELVARLRAVLRRRRLDDQGLTGKPRRGSISVRGLVLNDSAMSAELNGQSLDLGPTEFRLLYTLAANPNQVFSRESLIEKVMGRWYNAYDRSIDIHISVLRKKLGDTSKNSEWIRTVRGNGYMFLG